MVTASVDYFPNFIHACKSGPLFWNHQIEILNFKSFVTSECISLGLLCFFSFQNAWSFSCTEVFIDCNSSQNSKLSLKQMMASVLVMMIILRFQERFTRKKRQLDTESGQNLTCYGLKVTKEKAFSFFGCNSGSLFFSLLLNGNKFALVCVCVDGCIRTKSDQKPSSSWSKTRSEWKRSFTNHLNVSISVYMVA